MRLVNTAVVLLCLIAVVLSSYQNPYELPEDFVSCTGAFKGGHEWVGQLGDNACYKLLMTTTDGRTKRLRLKKKEAQDKCENETVQDGNFTIQGYLPLLKTPAQREAFLKLVNVSGKGTVRDNYWIGIRRITVHDYEWDDTEKVLVDDQTDWMWWWTELHNHMNWPYVVVKQKDGPIFDRDMGGFSSFIYCQKLIPLNLTLPPNTTVAPTSVTSFIPTAKTEMAYASGPTISIASAASHRPQVVVPEEWTVEPSSRGGLSNTDLAIYAAIGIILAALLTVGFIIPTIFWLKGKRNTATEEHHSNSPGHYFELRAISTNTPDMAAATAATA